MIHDITPVNNYTGNSSTTVFDFDFYIENSSQLEVYLFDKYGIKTKLTENIDYTINELRNPNGSYITFPIEGSQYDILDENQKLSLALYLPISQETQYNNSSLLNLATLEYSLDYLTRIVQILARKVELCVKAEECETNKPDELIETINRKVKEVNDVKDDVLGYLHSVEDYYDENTQIYENISEYSGILDDIDDLRSDIDDCTTSMGSLMKTDGSNIAEGFYSAFTNNLTGDAKSKIGTYGLPDFESANAVIVYKNTNFTATVNGWVWCAAKYTAGTYGYYRIYDPSGNFVYKGILGTAASDMISTPVCVFLPCQYSISITPGFELFHFVGNLNNESVHGKFIPAF